MDKKKERTATCPMPGHEFGCLFVILVVIPSYKVNMNMKHIHFAALPSYTSVRPVRPYMT